MNNEIYERCLLAKQQANGNNGYWTKLFNELVQEGYKFKTKEELRCKFNREKKKRNSLAQHANLPNANNKNSVYEQGKDFINIICSSDRILSEHDLIKQFNINTDEWEIEKFRIKTSEGYRKDRSVEWIVENGNVITGEVHDSGKMLVVPLYHIELRLVKKKKEVEISNLVNDLIEDAKRYSPKYNYYIKDTNKSEYVYEVAIPDVHFGRISYEGETGNDYDIDIATRNLINVAEKLLSYSKSYVISKFIIPIGNDFFNTDSKYWTTTKGTPQPEDVRWRNTFKAGRMLLVKIIDMFASISNVDVIIVPGNHDEQKSFYVGDSLECWYHNNKRVTVDNTQRTRKYYCFGKNLIGYTHGCNEKIQNLPMIMATEVPEFWANSKTREWHTGDKHHKKDIVYQTDEKIGVTIRILRSLAEADAWTFNNGFVGSLKAAESFLWHNEDGIIAQFTSSPN